MIVGHAEVQRCTAGFSRWLSVDSGNLSMEDCQPTVPVVARPGPKLMAKRADVRPPFVVETRCGC